MRMRNLFNPFSSDLAIDLGTANTLVYAKGKGIVVSEPSIVAINKVTNKVEAVGKEAKEMLGRTPGNIVAIRPMKDGVIADFEVTEKMLQHFIKKAHNGRSWVSPRVVIGVPGEITQVERRAVEDAAYRAKASKVYLVAEAMAAAIGAGLPELGSAFPIDEELQMEIKGRNLIEGVPRTIAITDEEVREALADPITTIVNAVRVALERTPPELSADIAERGIVLTGGGALLKGLDRRLMHETGVPVSLAENPLSSVALGAGKMLADFGLLSRVGWENTIIHHGL
ncbi:MAG: rod shape-determining protein [Blastocatellia bacterium AA13]|nr:MAG: rod shape-determining protein [Blastocatellia bacterium AA13]